MIRLFLLLLFSCYAATIWSQNGEGTECSANAGPDQKVCQCDLFKLSAPPSADYRVPLNCKWEYVPGLVAANLISFSSPNSLETAVNYLGSGCLPAGNYVFRFCVDCRDINFDGRSDRPCDEVTVTVTPPVTRPLIEAIGGLQQGELTVWCTEGDLKVNTLAPSETRSVTILPDDGLITKTEHDNIIHLVRNDTNNPEIQGACEYTVTSTITNGGCLSTVTKKIKFIRPQFSADGKVHGYINICPSCSNTLSLLGDRPGCGGKGVWTVVSTPAGAHSEIRFPNEENGDATAVVDTPGNYTFQYTVTNIEPCEPTVFQLTCTVFQVGEFSIGGGKTIYLCDTKFPKDTIQFCVDQLDDVIYDWYNVYGTPGLEITNPGAACSDIIFHQDVDLSTSAVQVRVTGLRYFIDPDCSGPLPYQVLHLPSQTNGLINQHFVDSLKATGACLIPCRTDGINFTIIGMPNPKVKKSDIYFLCSSGIETIRLQDYYTVQNNGLFYTSTTVEVLEQPATSHLVGSQIAPGQLIQLIGGCKYSFKVNVTFTNYSVIPAFSCSQPIILNVYISAPKNVSAGTDQIKCPKDPIRLNGNQPFDCNISGTWKQIPPFPPNCQDTVIIENPNDPNTRILIKNDSCCNYDLFFEWTFNSEDSDCSLSDTTKLHIKCCTGTPTCVQGITVKSLCKDGKIILTAYDDLGNQLDPSYQVIWTIDNNPLTGSINPYTHNGPGPIQYRVFVSRAYQDTIICAFEKNGKAGCPPTKCGIRIEENCDSLGNVKVTAIDLSTNLPVTPGQYIHRLYWRVYSAPNVPGILRQDVNPLIVHHNACYSLYYEHHYFPAGSLPTPGREDSICRFELPITCVSVDCPGPCKDFPDFTMAGFGDALNLPFPPGSVQVCNNTNGNGTLGVFLNGAPVTTPPYNILWKNTMTTTYVTGQILSINTVRITSPLKPGCFWDGKYEPICNCVSRPPEVNCQKPILKHCNDDGTVTYTPGQTQIVWTPISGATGYDIEVSVHDIEECCTGMAPSVTTYYSTTPYWNIPLNLTCFTVKVRAKDSNCPTPPDWSRPFTYCASIPCSPVLIVCGCCGGDRAVESISIEQIVVPETVFNQYQEAKSGIGFKTIEEALAALNSDKITGFAVFPNPTARLLTVKPDNTDQNTYQIELFDVLQRRVIQTQLDGTGEKTIDVSRLSDGMYLLTIRDSKGRLQCTKSVVVSK